MNTYPIKDLHIGFIGFSSCEFFQVKNDYVLRYVGYFPFHRYK